MEVRAKLKSATCHPPPPWGPSWNRGMCPDGAKPGTFRAQDGAQPVPPGTQHRVGPGVCSLAAFLTCLEFGSAFSPLTDHQLANVPPPAPVSDRRAV